MRPFLQRRICNTISAQLLPVEKAPSFFVCFQPRNGPVKPSLITTLTILFASSIIALETSDWRDESFCSRNIRRRRTCLGVDLQMPRVLLFRILHLCSCLFLRTFASIALCCLVPAGLRTLRMHHPSSCLLLLAASLRFACRASLNAFKTSALDFD